MFGPDPAALTSQRPIIRFGPCTITVRRAEYLNPGVATSRHCTSGVKRIYGNLLIQGETKTNGRNTTGNGA
jgi:hypothetical protein